jgi:hypothetical protein
MQTKFRLITVGNIDGFVSAILLKHLKYIDDVKFVTTKQMRCGEIETSETDICVNLPFVQNIHQAYDYHDNITTPQIVINQNHIIDTTAISGAEVIYNHHYQDLYTDTKLQQLITYSKNEKNRTLTTKERLEVYESFKNMFDREPVEAS